ncbi:MAG: 6,7-dimethyl-8-ribityllumazine synthase, partial [Rhodospirillales bacterium]|nr:6,7-dimethyl-8-ribityllumazine synthase [Rhodospirillales bacterium]
MSNILIVEARFYEDIADQLATGAVKVLEDAGMTVDRVAVPGVF